MSRAIPPIPNTPPWRGAQLKHRDNFNFTFTFYRPYALVGTTCSNTARGMQAFLPFYDTVCCDIINLARPSSQDETAYIQGSPPQSSDMEQSA
jgi:hypothetical protein